MGKSKLQVKIQKLRPLSLVLIFMFFIFNLTGCSTVKDTVRETAKGIIGVSTKEIEASRKDSLKKQFNYAYNDCYDKVIKVLKFIGAYVYTQDNTKNMIALYVSQTDTTAAGVFFTKIDANNTQVEVCSASTFAKEFIAESIFSQLEQWPDFEERLRIQENPLKGEDHAL